MRKPTSPQRRLLTQAGAAFLSVWFTFEVCRIDKMDGKLHFEATGRFMTVRQSSILGYETFPGFAGEQCVLVLLAGGKRRYIIATPEVTNTINRGSHPR